MDNNTSWNKKCMQYSEMAAKISMLADTVFEDKGEEKICSLFGKFEPIFRIACAKDPDLAKFLMGTIFAYKSENKDTNSAVVGMALSVMAYICNEKGKPLSEEDKTRLRRY